MTRAEKALQYFIIAVPKDKEQAEAYFWARRALNAAVRAERTAGEPGSLMTHADLLERAEAAEARVHELETTHRTEMCSDGYDCVQLGKTRKAAADAEARAEKAEKERDAAVSDLRGCAIESCAECMYCLYRTAKSFCWNCTDGSNWKWKGQKEG